jgi:ribosomal protein L34
LSAAAALLVTALVLPATASAQSDVTPPETTITQAPPNPSGKREATFAFTGVDNLTPVIDLEFQCRLDPQNAAPGTDPLDLWLDCLSPQFFTQLAPGEHTFEVQALDAEENIDPTPAKYTWIVGQATTCADASGKINADADAWFEEKSPIDVHGEDSELKLMSKAPGENSRAAVRFPLPQAPAGCVLQSAKLRLYSDSAPDLPQKLQALRLNSAWGENNIGWGNQPQTTGPAAEAPAAMGYVEWNVTAQVQAGASHGFLIRYATENDVAGAEAGFFSKEKLESPPELVLTYAGTAAGGGGAPAPPGAQPPATPGTPGAPGTAPAPTSKLAPTVAQLAAALRADLRRAATTLRRFGLAKLLRKKGANVAGVHALIPGKIQIATVFGGKRVVVLQGTRSFARAGKATLRLKLTKKGRQVLKRKRSAKFTLRGSFADRTAVIRASGPKVTVKRKGRR